MFSLTSNSHVMLIRKYDYEEFKGIVAKYIGSVIIESLNPIKSITQGIVMKSLDESVIVMAIGGSASNKLAVIYNGEDPRFISEVYKVSSPFV